jgi:hypothetical protein
MLIREHIAVPKRTTVKSYLKRIYGKLSAGRYAAINLGLFVVIFGCLGAYLLFRSFAASGPAAMPIISRGVPVYASSEQYPATSATDTSYDTTWRSSGPGWIALDLSSVPSAQRGQVDVAWYGNCCSYDNSISGTGAYNLPGAYTVEANTAAGGGSSAPSSGWTTLATVTNNTYHSRQHMVNLTGYNWVRMNITAIDGSAGNTDAAINLEVRNAAAGATDDWIFYGDSITEGAMGQTTSSNNIKSFQELVNTQVPNNFPVEENGGIGYQTTTSALTYIDAQLALFPGKYVGLSYGTNDANGGCGSTACLNTFYNNYAQLVQKVINLGKIPIVPTIPWGCTASLSANVPLYNQKIQTLYTNFPQIIKGPDLYAYFNTNQSYVSGNDCIHPSDPGMGNYRQLWANTMISAVYTSTPDTTPPVISSVAAGSISSSGATITWTTDEAADSQVEYGTTTSYGSATTLNTSMVTSHSVSLSSLSAGTLYHYRVKSKDAAGNLATSSDATLTTSAAATGLHVVGNKLYDASNNQVVLHGVNKSGTEYSCINNTGIFDPANSNTLQVVQSIKSWTGINAVRIPMNEDCWLAINGAPAAYSGANYQSALKAFVDLLVQNNIYPILELHWTAPGTTKATGQQPMLDRDHSTTFWTQVATAYKTYGTVIFDPHNEPFPDNNSDTNAAWQCWRDGGTCSGVSYQAAGMQEIVTAISQSQTCWDQAPASVATQVPLIAGEFGEHYDGAHCTNTLVNTFMNWMDTKNASYVAWTWNNWGDCLSLVTNESTGAATAWGTFYKNHVAALNSNPAPTASISASPTTISSGGSSTLTWSSTNAAACTASNGWSGSKTTSGSQSVSPTSTTTYTITCGSAVANATVTVGSSSPVAGDCNGDSHVIDLSTLLSHYNAAYATCDFNSDGVVNIFDLSILLSHYGT